MLKEDVICQTMRIFFFKKKAWDSTRFGNFSQHKTLFCCITKPCLKHSVSLLIPWPSTAGEALIRLCALETGYYMHGDRRKNLKQCLIQVMSSTPKPQILLIFLNTSQKNCSSLSFSFNLQLDETTAFLIAFHSWFLATGYRPVLQRIPLS